MHIFLWDTNTFIEPCYLDLQKEVELAPVFSSKIMKNMVFKPLNAILIIAYDDYIVYVDNW